MFPFQREKQGDGFECFLSKDLEKGNSRTVPLFLPKRNPLRKAKGQEKDWDWILE